MMVGCDAHFEDGVAVCSCSEAERFHDGQPFEDELRCDVCGRHGSDVQRFETLPPSGNTVAMCARCHQTSQIEIQRMLDDGAKF